MIIEWNNRGKKRLLYFQLSIELGSNEEEGRKVYTRVWSEIINRVIDHGSDVYPTFKIFLNIHRRWTDESPPPPQRAFPIYDLVLSLPIPSVPPAAISHTLRTESVISPAFIANRLKVKCTRGWISRRGEVRAFRAESEREGRWGVIGSERRRDKRLGGEGRAGPTHVLHRVLRQSFGWTRTQRKSRWCATHNSSTVELHCCHGALRVLYMLPRVFFTDEKATINPNVQTPRILSFRSMLETTLSFFLCFLSFLFPFLG